MPEKVEYLVVSINEFLKVTPSGEIDREETQKLLNTMADLIASSENHKILVDTREAYLVDRLTVFEIYQFVEELIKRRTTFHNRIAVLTREDFQFDNAKFFELCAKNRGFQVEVFTNFENAIEWFSKTNIYNAPQKVTIQK